ncbi:MAG: VWA domain-containing protein [Gammaproteobacteria bacterium]|nr:VWA domain-containing protein [Gammaproteobacteria bacterium]
MPESGFHFAQPQWFWGLLALPLVALWLWRSAAKAARGPIHRYADAHLLPHLSGNRELRHGERWGRFAAWSLLWLLLLTAMAGPRWDFTSVQLFHPGDNLLILMDISRSMDASDAAPSRLGRARQEVQDLILQNRRLRLGLIAFSSVPHVISPVTEDSRALMLALPAISTQLSQLQGSRLTAALERAEQLLAALPEDSAKSILLISDGDFAEPGLEQQVRRIAERGIPLHVLGVGTLDGAEVPGERGPLTGPSGQPVRSRLDEDQLRALANAGNGVYQRADYRDADTTAILENAVQSRQTAEASGDRTRVWHERFYLPLALLMLLLLPRFRGWLRTGRPAGRLGRSPRRPLGGPTGSGPGRTPSGTTGHPVGGRRTP